MKSYSQNLFITLQSLAEMVDGQIHNPNPNQPIEELRIQQALPIRDATIPCITMADSERQAKKVDQTAAIAVVVKQKTEGTHKPQLIVADIHKAFAQIVRLFRRHASEAVPSIHPSANIHPSAKLGNAVSIGPNVTVGPECRIGDQTVVGAGASIGAHCTIGTQTRLFANVVLYDGSIVGNNCILHASVTIGAYGFGYRQVNHEHALTAQLGWVEIEDSVEIGASSTIDRGTYGMTRIGSGTKIDNQVQIGHNCHIGPHNLICAHVGIAGSTTTGSHVVLAGQAGLADHLHLGDGATVGAQAGVMQDVKPGDVVLGSPAGPRKQKMKEFAATMRLPELRKEIRDLKKQLDAIQETSSNIINREAA